MPSHPFLLRVIREHSIDLSRSGYDSLIAEMANSKFALIGEASHGTHEFYQTRAQLTQRLISEKGFSAVAVEADWPDAYRVNRYVQNRSTDSSAVEALGGFKRFPTWMWRNLDVVDFIEWLRGHNDALPSGSRKVAFYGMDLYSLHSSARAVLDFLEKVDPEAAKRARFRYSCFEDFGEDPQAYGYSASFGLTKSCEDEVVKQLVEMQERAAEFASRYLTDDPEDLFNAEQNARVVKNAEHYYRSMFGSRVSTWNLRDKHMFETLEVVREHLGQSAKIAVWAHNSHLGDARATEMGDHGELNVGQLVRERYGKESTLVGFTTYKGTVTASSDWDGPADRKRVRPGMNGSYEQLFHETGVASLLLPLRHNSWLAESFYEKRLERAIGVIYRPDTERISHYFHARLPEQFDAVIHFDETHAVEPLERTAQWEAAEPPETYPFAV